MKGLHDNVWRSINNHPENSYEAKMATVDYLAGDYLSLEEKDSIRENTYVEPIKQINATINFWNKRTEKEGKAILWNTYLLVYKNEVLDHPIIWYPRYCLTYNGFNKEGFTCIKDFYEKWRDENMKELHEYKELVLQNKKLSEELSKTQNLLKNCKKINDIILKYNITNDIELEEALNYYKEHNC